MAEDRGAPFLQDKGIKIDPGQRTLSLESGGRLAFLLKDYIDRKFMQKSQVSGEMNEPG